MRTFLLSSLQYDTHLCEYFLACIEERLIEHLLFSDFHNTSSLVSLCSMTPLGLHSILSRFNPFYKRSLRLLTDKYNPLTYPDLKMHNVLVNQLIDSNSEGNQVSAIAMQHFPSPSGLYVLRDNSVEVQPVASVLVTLSRSNLKIVFCDDPVEEAVKSHSLKQGEDNELLCIYLPHHLRLNFTRNECPSNSSSNLPLCLSVTLIYPSPWWRDLLSLAMEPISLFYEGHGVDLDEIPESNAPPAVFSFIPEDRATRGFCHTFRDLSPSVGYLGLFRLLPSNLGA